MPNTMLSLTTAPNTTNYYSVTTESDVSGYADSSYADSDFDAPTNRCSNTASNTSHEIDDSAPQTPDTISEFDTDDSDNESNESNFEHGPLSGSMIVHRAFYHAEPYTFIGKAFDELPEAAQKFLVKMGLWPMDEETFDREEFFERVYTIREARRDRLERTLEGVSRAIAKEMLVRADEGPASATNVHGGGEGPASGAATPGLAPSARENVVGVLLYPEWQEHLEAYVEEIDALIWVDMRLRLGAEPSLSVKGYLREREEDVERMTEFAVQCLQRTFERVKEERGAAWLMEKIMEGKRGEGDDLFESIDSIAHISPVSPLSGAEENGQWVTVTA
ncbi:unnamed protein product [Cyclocybe aegerita]|uniref:Uncharacterized protein n=1 Tax=Cyclocybe aegerita TaxID=1973307 RepID=A0A8S0X208_CYCAE|nr:unnamed protein product [Cyclocybe aegerita]